MQANKKICEFDQCQACKYSVHTKIEVLMIIQVVLLANFFCQCRHFFNPYFLHNLDVIPKFSFVCAKVPPFLIDPKPFSKKKKAIIANTYAREITHDDKQQQKRIKTF